jgi:hypothetical protein
MPECDPKDFFDTDVKLQDTLSKLAYLENLSQNQFDDLKKAGKLNSTIPVGDIPIGVDLNYDQTQTTVQQLSRLYQLDYTDQQHTAIFSSILSDNGLNAYRACVAGRGVVGTTLTRSRDALNSINFFVGVRWDGGVGGPEGKFDFVGPSPFQIIGGKVTGPDAKTPPRRIKSGQEILVQIQRDNLSAPFKFSTSVNGYLGQPTIELPAYAPRTLKFQVRSSDTLTVSSDFGPGGTNGGDQVLVKEFAAADNEEFIVATAQLVGRTAGNFSEIKVVAKDEKRIQWQVRAYTDSKAHGAFAQAYVSVISASWT